jgi:cytochrome c553
VTDPAMAMAPDAALVDQRGGDVLEGCARCHGREGLGRGTGAFPKLAGQRSEYLVNALRAYAKGARHSGIMEPVAAVLSDQLIQNLARHYADSDPSLGRLNPPRNATVALNDQLLVEIARGEEIAKRGIPARRIPSCIECHGPKGSRTKPAYPSLAGESADYLVLQLNLFKDQKRGGSEYAHLMAKVAPRLKPEEMRAVAQYFESLPMETER